MHNENKTLGQLAQEFTSNYSGTRTQPREDEVKKIISESAREILIAKGYIQG